MKASGDRVVGVGEGIRGQSGGSGWRHQRTEWWEWVKASGDRVVGVAEGIRRQSGGSGGRHQGTECWGLVKASTKVVGARECGKAFRNTSCKNETKTHSMVTMTTGQCTWVIQMPHTVPLCIQPTLPGCSLDCRYPGNGPS